MGGLEKGEWFGLWWGEGWSWWEREEVVEEEGENRIGIEFGDGFLRIFVFRIWIGVELESD